MKHLFILFFTYFQTIWWMNDWSWRFFNCLNFFSSQKWIFVVLNRWNPLSSCEWIRSVNSYRVYVEQRGSWHKVHPYSVFPMESCGVPCCASLIQWGSQACFVHFLNLKSIFTTTAVIVFTKESENWANVLSSHFYSAKSSWWANTYEMNFSAWRGPPFSKT